MALRVSSSMPHPLWCFGLAAYAQFPRKPGASLPQCGESRVDASIGGPPAGPTPVFRLGSIAQFEVERVGLRLDFSLEPGGLLQLVLGRDQPLRLRVDFHAVPLVG